MPGPNAKAPKWMTDQLPTVEDFFNVCKHPSFHFVGSVRACVDCGKHLAAGMHRDDPEYRPRPPTPRGGGR